MPIQSSCRDGVARLQIDRPEKLNALDPSHLVELRQKLVAASEDPSVNVIVLSGAGKKAFCVGADLSHVPQNSASVAEAFSFGLEESSSGGLYIRLFDFSGLKIKKPLIAAVSGYCLGGGLEIALQCDMIVASKSSQFGLPEVAIASLAGGGGVSNLLRAIPKSVAMYMVLSGDRIWAERAYQLGLICQLTDDDSLEICVDEVAQKIARNGPLAVQLTKMLADLDYGLGPGQAMQLTELAWGLLRDTEDRREGRAAFKEGRAPNFHGR